MFSKLKSSVVNFYHHLCHSNDMTPTRPVIPSVFEHITAYCQKLEAINDSIGTEQLKGHRVVELAGFKTYDISRHKYAQANVAAPESKKTTFLTFERMRGKTFDTDTTSLKSQNPELEASTPGSSTHSSSDRGKLTAHASSSRSSFTSFTSASTSLSPQHFADDRVTPLLSLGQWSSDDRLLFTLTFDLQPLYLYKLALLVEVIHQENQSYKLLSNNCYHLLGTMVLTLKRTHNAQVRLDKWEDDAGKCCGLNILSLGHGDISSICKKFITRRDDFISLLYMLSDGTLLYILCYSGERVVSRRLPVLNRTMPVSKES